MPKTLPELLEEFNETFKNPVNVDLTLHGMTSRYNAKDEIESFIRYVYASALEYGANRIPYKRNPEPNKHSYPFSNANTASRGWNDAIEACRDILLEESKNAKEVK